MPIIITPLLLLSKLIPHPLPSLFSVLSHHKVNWPWVFFFFPDFLPLLLSPPKAQGGGPSQLCNRLLWKYILFLHSLVLHWFQASETNFVKVEIILHGIQPSFIQLLYQKFYLRFSVKATKGLEKSTMPYLIPFYLYSCIKVQEEVANKRGIQAFMIPPASYQQNLSPAILNNPAEVKRKKKYSHSLQKQPGFIYYY